MQWPALLPLLFQSYGGSPPDILLVHLGGNDLGLVQGRALVLQVVEDLQVIKAKWPGTWVIWSAIVPRLSWRNALEPRVMNKARKNANREIKRALLGGLGQYLPHPELRLERPDLYRSDGVHLADEGLDIFIQDLQQGLRHSLGLQVGANA